MTELKPTEFRDSVSTIDEKGKRVWLHPKKPKGRYHSWRSIVATLLLAFMFGMPFVELDGHPLFLFNVLERKFILFGMVFWPQDFHLFALALITGVVSIIFFTVMYGRIFCGWVCPQTIFMEMVFRKIEYFFEGDYTKQKKLDKRSWSDNEKILKRGGKHAVFILLSILISNTFLAWIIGKDELFRIISEPISEHIAGFTAIIIFSTAFYWVFSWFREQVCIIACPYGRLQGVMLDPNSLVVAYDYKRGEPREKLRKNEDRTSGDCIDCKQCVHVCPTGIDIRNGTQLECINCTACIDACDTIMDKINKPRGLVGFHSETGIEQGKKFKLSIRIVSYSLVLIALIIAVSTFLFNRNDLEITVLRERVGNYQTLDNGIIRNMYQLNLINKTYKDIEVHLALENIEGEITVVGNEILVPSQDGIDTKLAIDIKETQLDVLKTTIIIGIYEGNQKIEVFETNFLGPGL